MKLFSGTCNPELARKIAQHLDCSLAEADIVRFPDGETFVKIKDSVRGKDCFVIQSVCGQPNEMLMELLIMIDALKRASAGRITAVLPIYGYARQDRKDQPRVPITAKLVANLLTTAGANRVLTMDLHAAQIVGYFDIPVDHVHAFPVIHRHVRELGLENPVVLAPDTGSAKNAHAYSKMMGCNFAITTKERRGAEDVEAYSLVGSVDGCDVVIIDDLTSTCGTLCAAATMAKQHGARRVFAAVTHGMLNAKGLERLAASDIDELAVTDTVPQRDPAGTKVRVLSVAGIFGEAIDRIHNNKSVHSLFHL